MNWKDELTPLLRNNEEWAQQKAKTDPAYFSKNSKEQITP